MGYRTYIGFLPKENYDLVKNLNRKELYSYIHDNINDIDEEDMYVGMYEIGRELYEFGKYTEFDDSNFYQPFFHNVETQKYYEEEHDAYIVGKEYLAHIIKYYHQLIADYYQKQYTVISEFQEKYKTINAEKGVIENFNLSKLIPILDSVNSMRMEWTHLTPYNLDEGDEICLSWKYEYAIFELINIYKNFDWENNVMYYYGY